MAKQRSRGKLGNILTFIVATVLMLAVAGSLVFLFRDKGDDDGTRVINSITLEGNKLIGGAEIALPVNEALRFDVDGNDYEVKVRPNGNTAPVSFFVDDQEYSFQSEIDLTECFSILKDKNGFTLKIEKNILGILESLYPNRAITVPEVDMNSEPFFLLSLETVNGEVVFWAPFKANVNVFVENVFIDKEELLF